MPRKYIKSLDNQIKEEQKKITFDINFNKIIKMVEDGYTISKALKKLTICSHFFYYNISKEQKVLLQLTKTANAKYKTRKLY